MRVNSTVCAGRGYHLTLGSSASYPHIARGWGEEFAPRDRASPLLRRSSASFLLNKELGDIIEAAERQTVPSGANASPATSNEEI